MGLHLTRMVKYQVQKCYSSVIAGAAILALDKIKRTGTDKVLPLCELVNWVKVQVERNQKRRAGLEGSQHTRTQLRFVLVLNQLHQLNSQRRLTTHD